MSPVTPFQVTPRLEVPAAINRPPYVGKRAPKHYEGDDVQSPEINRRTERMQGAHQKQVKDLQAQLEAANKHADQFTGRVLSDTVRAAGLDAGIHKSAVADAIFRAQGAFVVDENGELAARENALDKQGKPLTLKAWFDDMRDSAPHWFPAPQGGGLSADSGAGVKKRGGMTAQEIKAYIDRHGMQAYLKLPK